MAGPLIHRHGIDGSDGRVGIGMVEYYAEVKRKAQLLAERFPIHPLHTRELVAKHILATGQLLGERGTGRTTARIVSAIGSALSRLGDVIMINDHHKSLKELYYSQWLKGEVISSIRKLGLRKMWVGWQYEWVDFDQYADTPRVLNAGVVIQFGEPIAEDKERYCMREVTYGS